MQGIIWITGLSGSGKTTLANSTAEKLNGAGIRSIVLDGDEMRRGLCSDLGFSLRDRAENIRRVAETGRLFAKAGMVTLIAVISPTREGRRQAREIIGRDLFVEVWCRCPLQVCEARDPKNLYRRARGGEISEFTGLTSIYENPEHPDLIIDTDLRSIDESLEMLLDFLKRKKGLNLAT